MRHNNLYDVTEIRLRHMPEPEGILVPIQGEPDIPFDIKRVFYVFQPEVGIIRGKHAHFACQQVLIALEGRIEVSCKDGTSERKFVLDEPTRSIYIPTGIWTEEKYCTKNTILLSLCSHKYARADYMHDWNSFVEWRNS